MIKVSFLVDYVKKQVGKPYWYGTYGQTGSEAVLNGCHSRYPTQMTENRMKKARSRGDIGKTVHDCSGLIKAPLMKSTPEGTLCYRANFDRSANMMYQDASIKGSLSTMPETPGIILHRNNHVGVYIGNGEVIEAKGFDYGVIKSKVSDSTWLHWFQHKDVDYSEGVVIEDKKSDPKPVKSVIYKVIAQSGLNIRSGRGTNYNKVGAYNYGERIEVSEIVNNWATTPKGYVCADYIKKV